MNSHWPVLLAILMVGAAGAFGYWTQLEYQEKGKVVSPIKTLPAHYISIAATKPAGSAAAGQPAEAATNTQGKWVPDVNQRQTPQAQAQLVAALKQQNIAANAPKEMADRDAVFNTLRVALNQKFGAQPVATNVGFAVAVAGARLEVDASPAWSISLYNDNKAQPAVQSENFVGMLNLVAANLDFDPNVNGNTTGDGKITRRPISKLGKLSMLTDPAMNNSITIRPVVRKPANPALPANPVAVNPAAPVNPAIPAGPLVPAKPPKAPKPTPFPAEPVKPPTTDQF